MPINLAEKRAKFIKLANIRTNEVIRRIRILSNLHNRSAYEYSNNDIKKIFTELENEIKLAKLKFNGTNKKQFKLE